ncbi:MAG: hypothetical protein JWQ09_3132 [Segetibacter sp.]|nr:hypothetical protein [Segetibacter sp.]
MEAKARSFTFMSNEGIVKIPFFQRGYVWKETHWEDLLDDLADVSRTHFLGSIILKQQKTKTGEPKELLVIDGQQRLTTLSILIKALYDSFSEDIRENSKDTIRNNLFFKKNRTDKEFLVKIQHSQIDAEAFRKVIQCGLDGQPALTISANNKNRILECYSYFSRKLNTFSDDNRVSLFESILDNENKFLVVIDLDEKDEEQSIFDTINSSGVTLSPADIIKNALFQRMIELTDQLQATKIYEKNWKEVFLSDDDTISFWEAQRATGRLMRDNIAILLHSIAVIKGFYDPDLHTLSDLSKLYKEQIEEYKDSASLQKFIEEISSYAQIYRDKILVFNSSTMFSFDNYEQRLFHVLEVLEISTFHPFILYVYQHYSAVENTRKEIFTLLENFVVRRAISKMELKSFNKLCKEFIKKSDLLSEKIKEMDENGFISGLKQITNKNAALILFWIELRRRHVNNKFSLKHLKYDYTLEHLMPQKWEEFWANVPTKYNADGTAMLPDVAKRDRYEKIYWIGNMTLLTSSLNTALRNYEFVRKMEGDGRKRGIKAYDDLSITKTDIVEPFDQGDKTWEEAKIIKRTDSISQEVLDIWKPLQLKQTVSA